MNTFSTNSFSSRLKELREKFKYSQDGLAKKIGVSKTSIQNYESGKIPKGDHIIKLAKALDCSLDWLLIGQYQKEPHQQNPEPNNFGYIPMAEAYLSAGGGAVVLSDEIKNYYAFRKEFLRRITNNIEKLILMRVKGDSMIGIIEDGDVVMIDMSKKDRIIDGYIYAIGLDDSILIKKLKQRPENKVLVISENNHEFCNFLISKSELRIIGQVIWSAHQYV